MDNIEHDMKKKLHVGIKRKYKQTYIFINTNIQLQFSC